MKVLKVERLDAKYVYCIDNEKKAYAIEVAETPAGVKPGNTLKIDDEGNITVSAEK